MGLTTHAGCSGCPALCAARSATAEQASYAVSARALTAISAVVFGVPVLLLCLLIPVLGNATPIAQGLLILLSVALSGSLARWYAPVLERQVVRNGGGPLR